MRYWYGYTGNQLVLGNGRAIRQVVPGSSAVQDILSKAQEQYAGYAATALRQAQPVPAETLIAALIAPLAEQALQTVSPPATVFSSAAQVFRLFGGLNIEQVAVNLFNGRITSAYDTSNLPARVAQGFDKGELLILPRDSVRLHSKDVLNSLPGVIVYLLSNTQAERKAFANYLRRGTSPVVPHETKTAIAKQRPIMRTWEREMFLVKHRSCPC